MGSVAASVTQGSAAAEVAGERQHHALLLSVCCAAQFMVILDVSIVNVALPSIKASLGFSVADLQWIVNAYAITFAGFLMLGGRAADLLGQRRTFVTGLLLFALASLAGGLAADRAMLIGARAAQGLGAAVMAPASLAIITSSFAAGPARHRAVGLWGSMAGAGGATGTLLGGVITQELSWRWILLINLPVGVAAALVAHVAVAERRRAATNASFDLAGALSITCGLLALVFGIVQASSHSLGSPDTLVPVLLGIALLGSFVFIEGRIAVAPLVPLRTFSNSLLRTSNIVMFMFSAALFPMWYFTSLYLQDVLQMTPLGAGLAFLPMALTIMACAPLAGRMVARYGAGPVLGCGLTVMAAGMALFAMISVNGQYDSDVLLPGLLVSAGVGFSVVPATIAATSSARPQEAGLAAGLVNTSRQMGGAVGLAILTSVAAQFTSHLASADFKAPIVALTSGFRLAYLLGAVFVAIGAITTFRLIPRIRPGAPAQGAPAADPPPKGGELTSQAAGSVDQAQGTAQATEPPSDAAPAQIAATDAWSNGSGTAHQTRNSLAHPEGLRGPVTGSAADRGFARPVMWSSGELRWQMSASSTTTLEARDAALARATGWG